MPYGPKDEPSGTAGLPAHARAIFKKAANAAYAKYGEDAEARAHKIAWGAIKNAGYYKNKEGKWVAGDGLSVKDAIAKALKRATRLKDRTRKRTTVRDPRGRLKEEWETEEYEDSARTPLISEIIVDRAMDWNRAPICDATSPQMMFDALEFDDAAKLRITDDGYMVATPRIARAGIQVYRGGECGKADMETIKVYRPPDEVFSSDAMRSMTHRPVTIEHPDEPVTADNWKQHAVGQTGEEVVRDGNAIRVPMVLMDSAAIKAVKDGKQQLSVGYNCDLDWTPGVTDSGEKYDAVQRNIRANHLAVVAAARGGPTLKIGDDAKAKESAMNLKTILVDGIECQMSDTATVLVQRTLQRLQDQIENFKKKAKESEESEEEMREDSATKDAEIAKRDEAIKTKDAEIVTLKQQLKDAQAELDPTKLDARVIDRLSVISKAKAFLGDKFVAGGKSANDIRREVLTQKVGDKAKAWNDAQIEAAFESLQVPTFSQNKDSGRSAIDDAVQVFGRPGSGYTNMQDARVAAYDSYDKEIAEAWRSKPAA